VAARFVLVSGPARSQSLEGRLDLPGTITGTAGVAALVYGLSNAATSPNGTSHWGDAKVVVALVASAVLLAAFAVLESRNRHALLPVRLLRNRNRVGAYLMMLGVGTAIAGVFFFLTLFVQDVWGYSALRTGAAFLPVTAAMFVGAIGASALVPRIGARPLLVGGSAVTVGGLYWLSRMTEHGTYAGDLLGAGLVLGVGFGLLIVPLQLLSLTRVGEADSGVAASLLNAGRQVGGAIGLAVLGTVAWTVVADNAHSGAAAVGSSAYQHALAVGFDRAFLVGAGIAVLILLTALTTIRIRRADLAGS
jgi:predicted MFS family arabinose efflux permease